MRVVAGEFRGRRLKSVPSKQTRPTSDKVKEAVFQMIGPFFQGGICLDLFAGSGSLGIEAISRGMERVYFIDKQRKAIETVYENVKTMKLEEKTEVFRMDAFQALRVISKRKTSFNLILIDPPYKEVNFEKLLNEIMRNNLLAKNGIIYCEHDPSDNLPQSQRSLNIVRQINYGKTTGVTIYRKSTKESLED